MSSTIVGELRSILISSHAQILKEELKKILDKRDIPWELVKFIQSTDRSVTLRFDGKDILQWMPLVVIVGENSFYTIEWTLRDMTNE